MANIGDSANSEKGRVLAVALQTLAAIILTAIICEFAGLWIVFDFISAQDIRVGMALSVMIWGGVMLLAARPGAVIRLILRIAVFALRIAARPLLWTMRLFAAFPPAAAAYVLGPSYELYRMRWQNFTAPGMNRLTRWRSRMALEWKLWRAYRAEFRAQFGSCRQFRAQFDAMGRAEQERKARLAADPFRAACRTMGLPEDGRFSEAAFKTRYRDLMKALHPDIAGPNERAASVNAASATIKERKGWS
ncbi:MAG: hypothetical protein DCC64_15865 [Planctomycetota bacterium]|nr:MAG: hypothetical protein DCC64_15865 [Planctomycetota bacterium]